MRVLATSFSILVLIACDSGGNNSGSKPSASKNKEAFGKSVPSAVEFKVNLEKAGAVEFQVATSENEVAKALVDSLVRKLNECSDTLAGSKSDWISGRCDFVVGEAKTCTAKVERFECMNGSYEVGQKGKDLTVPFRFRVRGDNE